MHNLFYKIQTAQRVNVYNHLSLFIKNSQDKHLISPGFGEAPFENDYTNPNNFSSGNRIAHRLPIECTALDIFSVNSYYAHSDCAYWGQDWCRPNPLLGMGNIASSIIVPDDFYEIHTKKIFFNNYCSTNYGGTQSLRKNYFYNSGWGFSGGPETSSYLDPYGMSINSHLYASFMSGSFMPMANYFGAIDYHRNFVRDIRSIQTGKKKDCVNSNLTFIGEPLILNSPYWMSHITTFANFASRIKKFDRRLGVHNQDGSCISNMQKKIRIYNNSSGQTTRDVYAVMTVEKETDEYYGYGYLQDKRFGFNFLMNNLGCNYILNLQNKPIHLNYVYSLRFDINDTNLSGQEECIKLEFFDKSHPNLVSISENYVRPWRDQGPIFNGQKVVNVQIPPLNGRFGDVLFIAESVGHRVGSIGSSSVDQETSNIIDICLDSDLELSLADFCNRTIERVMIELSIVDLDMFMPVVNTPNKAIYIDYTNFSSIRNFSLKSLFALNPSSNSWPLTWSNFSLVNFTCNNSVNLDSCLSWLELPGSMIYKLKTASFFPYREHAIFFRLIQDCGPAEPTTPVSRTTDNVSKSIGISRLSVYNNPSLDVIFESIVGEFRLFDSMGRILYNGNDKISVTDLLTLSPNGVYLLCSSSNCYKLVLVD